MMHRIAVLLLFNVLFSLHAAAQLLPKKGSNALWGYVKKASADRFKIEPVYQYACYFAPNQLARVQQQSAWLLITTKGKIVSQPFDSLGWSNESAKESIQTPFLQGVIGAKRNGKWGWVNAQGTWVMPPTFTTLTRVGTLIAAQSNDGWQLYHPDATAAHNDDVDSVQWLPNGEIAAWQSGAAALLDATGKVLTPFQYRAIDTTKASLALTSYPLIELLAATEREQSHRLYADSIAWAGTNRFWVKRQRKWALAQADSFLTPFTWDSVTVFRGQMAAVATQNKWGAISLEGVLLIPIKYQHIVQDSTGLFRCKQGERTDYFSSEGRQYPQAVVPDWLAEQPDAYGWYLAQKDGQFGYVDAQLTPTIPFTYAAATAFVGNFAAVRQGAYYGVINRQKEWIIRPVVDSLWVLSPYAFVFHDRGQWGTLDSLGVERFVAQQGDTYQPYGKGLLLQRAKAEGFVNEWGHLVVPPVYDAVALHTDSLYLQIVRHDTLLYAHRYRNEIPSTSACEPWTFTAALSEGFIPIRWQGNAGFVDALCLLRISTQYENVQSFSEGMAAVQFQGKWGFIDKQEHLKVQPRYEAVTPFHQGVSVVTLQGKQGLIDHAGNTILPCEYDSLRQTSRANWLLWQSGSVGIFSIKERFLLYPNYEKIQDTASDWVIVQKEGQYGLNHRNGVHIRFTEYQNIKPLGQHYFMITLQQARTTER